MPLLNDTDLWFFLVKPAFLEVPPSDLLQNDTSRCKSDCNSVLCWFHSATCKHRKNPSKNLILYGQFGLRLTEVLGFGVCTSGEKKAPPAGANSEWYVASFVLTSASLITAWWGWKEGDWLPWWHIAGDEGLGGSAQSKLGYLRSPKAHKLKEWKGSIEKYLS
jgi:hypothetical protein